MNNPHNILKMPTRQARPEESMTRLGSHFTFPGAAEEPTGLNWHCPECGMEVLPMHLANGLWVRRRACACKAQAREQAEQESMRQAWMANQTYRTFGGWLGKEWTDTDLAKKTFRTFKRQRDAHAYREALKFADSMQGNLVFYGDYGTGKTHLAAAICNALRERRVTSLFVTAPKFFATYNDRMNHDADHHNLIKQAIGTPLLVLDDVDKSHPTDARLDLYYLILDERYKASKPTILTTNSMASLDNYIGAAARSRIMRGLVAVEMIGDDHRMEE